MIIGVIGLINSGKSTVADVLVKQHNFTKVSFADSLKDAAAAIFGWPRELLQGDTDQSRQWREQVDDYWSRVMQHPVTPRWVLQHFGSEVMRNQFHKDIWVHSLMKKLDDLNKNYVISDVRFLNEIDVILSQNGTIWKVERPPIPTWCSTEFKDQQDLTRYMKLYHPEVHRSEWEWHLARTTAVIQNDSSIESLKDKIKTILSTNIMT